MEEQTSRAPDDRSGGNKHRCWLHLQKRDILVRPDVPLSLQVEAPALLQQRRVPSFAGRTMRGEDTRQGGVLLQRRKLQQKSSGGRNETGARHFSFLFLVKFT